MTHAALATATATAWVWLGMVLAISFLEAPLKFRVLDLRTGLAVGRVVVRALNGVEVVAALVLVVALVAARPGTAAAIAGGVAVAVLGAQLSASGLR